MKTLLIGGCGYVGSSLYLWLKDKHQVDTIDLEWFGNHVNPANIKADFASLSEEQLQQYEVIILLAGHSSVQMSTRRWPTFANNVINFIALMQKLKQQKFIYASTSSVYGGMQYASEADTSYIPQNYYDLTKKTIDYFANLSDLDFYALRFGTICGVSPNLRVDLMLNKMYHSAINTGTITVTNPGVSRPILGVRDVCRAIQVIMESPSHRGVYNLASCNGTVLEMANAVSNKTKADVKIAEGATAYDFTIATSKFQETFKFRFGESVESIIEDLHNSFEECHCTTRESPIPYDV